MASVTATTGRMKKGGVADTTRFLLLIFLVAVIFRTFVFAPFMIPSGSMLPRMMIGDYLFVAKWPYGISRYSLPFGLGHFHGRWFARPPERGDVVVFRYPGSDQDYVKRLIGLPGDRIQVQGGRLILNGRPVPKLRIADYLMPRSANSPCRYVHPEGELPLVIDRGRAYCRYARYREILPGGRSYEVLDQIPNGEGDDTSIYVVPAGHYFMMGDNRDDSEDSRFPLSVGGVGFLPDDNLIGRAEVTFFSTDGNSAWTKPWTWASAARWSRIGGTY
ncbi:MAG: lepB [Alphaproteobacteria bacterium]|nr:lepB [Alphaproteobacteria bacterium]MDB5721161.1 lepB [Alphaproteobacteria bacterium]